MNYAETIHPLIIESDQLIKKIFFELAPLYKEEFPHGQDVTVPLFTVLHSTSESILILLLNGAIYESDILLRTVMEGTIKYCYLMCGSTDVRAQRYREYKDELTEIDKLLDHRKALEAIEILKEFSNNSLKPFEISILNNETVTELEAKYPNRKRNDLKQKWSYGHLLRELAKDNKEYEGQLATLSSYSLMSHFCHFDWTGVSDRNAQIISAARGDETLDIGHALRILSNTLSCYLFRVAEYMRGNSYSTPILLKTTMDIYHLVVLQFLYEPLRSNAVGAATAFLTLCEFGKYTVQSGENVVPFFFRVISSLYLTLLVSVGTAPPLFRLVLVLLTGGFVFAVIKRAHCDLSFFCLFQSCDQSFQPIFLQHQQPLLLFKRFLLIVTRRGEDLSDAFQRKIQLTVKQDFLHAFKRIFVVKPIAILLVYKAWLQQTDLIIIMQCAHTDTGKLGKFFDL